MAHTRSARKMIRIQRQQRGRNRSVRSAVKSRIKTAERLILHGDQGLARQAVVQAISALDRAGRKGVIHAHNAARRKSRLSKKLNATLTTQS